jgi:hypothetical protein
MFNAQYPMFNAGRRQRVRREQGMQGMKEEDKAMMNADKRR